MSGPSESRQTLMASLHRQLDRIAAGGPVKDEEPVSTGVAALDRLLPAGGLKRGTLVEYLATASGCGAGTLALSAAREACRAGRALVVVEGTVKSRSMARFYPPAAAAWGIDLARLLVLRPVSEADALWALDQALRCAGVGAVWAPWDAFDARDFRRLQLAAEAGGTMGLLIRPARQRGQPTWADVQWEVRPCRPLSESRKSKVGRSAACDPQLSTWWIQVELARCRGGAGARAVILELDETAGNWQEVTDEATRAVPVLAPVADSTSPRRA